MRLVYFLTLHWPSARLVVALTVHRMAALKFCANISWLFTELPEFSQRLQAAAAAGFRAVEAAWLYDCDVAKLVEAKKQAGVEVVLLNTPPGKTNPQHFLSHLE